jgi:peptide/nickel transport system permease protein
MNQMRHLLRRIGFYLVAFWGAITLNFLIPRLAPGDPVAGLIARFQGRGITPTEVQALELEFGNTHAPLWTQYIQYIGQLAHGNLGLSITYYPTPVATVIGQELPWSLGLYGLSIIISFALGSLIGVFVAWRRGSWSDALATPFLSFFSAIPYFWLALILLYVLAYDLNWFPLNGGYGIDVTESWTWPFIQSVVQHGLLPALTIVISSIAGWLLTMRNTMITTLSEDYVLMAEAKGLKERRVMLAYAARNAILPNVTNFAMSLGFVVAGALLTEIVFSYPGIGFALLQAVQQLDYPLIEGIFLLVAVAIIGANFLVDLLYTILDPRVRLGRS